MTDATTEKCNGVTFIHQKLFLKETRSGLLGILCCGRDTAGKDQLSPGWAGRVEATSLLCDLCRTQGSALVTSWSKESTTLASNGWKITWNNTKSISDARKGTLIADAFTLRRTILNFP